jgi:hypothetical protein
MSPPCRVPIVVSLADLSAVSLNTAPWDAMVSELDAMGVEQLHFPLVALCACCEPITHIRTPIPQVIPPTATWYLAAGQPVSPFTMSKLPFTMSKLQSVFMLYTCMLYFVGSAHQWE